MKIEESHELCSALNPQGEDDLAARKMKAFVGPVLSRTIRRRAPLCMCTSAPRANKDVVAHTARLAHLQLNDEQVERIVPDFDKMLKFVDSINQLELDESTDAKSSARAVSGDEQRADEPVAFPYVFVFPLRAPCSDCIAHVF